MKMWQFRCSGLLIGCWWRSWAISLIENCKNAQFLKHFTPPPVQLYTLSPIHLTSLKSATSFWHPQWCVTGGTPTPQYKSSWSIQFLPMKTLCFTLWDFKSANQNELSDKNQWETGFENLPWLAVRHKWVSRWSLLNLFYRGQDIQPFHFHQK